MGLLAENKSRTRIHHDPNNTRWTRDTTAFGQKILRSQGWEPGQYLGAQDAAHSGLHTSANASYIRVILKDDMKGLGYNKAKENEVTGLDIFSDLLSRLNGKGTAEVESERQARLVVKTHQYVEQRWGAMRFVRGGLLVGDTMQEVDENKPTDSAEDSKDSESDQNPTLPPTTIKKEKTKKRKAESLEDDSVVSDKDDEKRKKKLRKEEKKAKKKLAESSVDESNGDGTDGDASTKKDKKDRKDKKKKEKKEKSRREATESDDASQRASLTDESIQDAKAAKKARKEKKKLDKKEKRDKKDQKKKRKAESGDPDTEMSDVAPQTLVSTLTTGTSTPTGTGTSTPMPNRNYVRSRFIAQKRQAVLDSEALNQIFMVKALS